VPAALTKKPKSLKVFLGVHGVLPSFVELRPGHLVIFGRTGSGKTNTAKLIASALAKKVPVLVLDWAGEYDIGGFKVLRPGDDLRINPLEHVSGDFSEHLDFLVDLFGDTFDFTEPQRFMFRIALKTAFARTGAPTLQDVLKVMDSLPPRSYYDNEIKMAIRRRLTQLTEGRVGRALSATRLDLSQLFEEKVTIDLSVFRSVHSRRLFVLLMLKLLYDYAVTYRGQCDCIAHATIIEEAWNVIPYRRLDARPSIGERLFAELRKYGECIVAVSQSPVETAWSVTKNARVIILHPGLSKDAESIGLLTQEDVKLENLDVGEALLIQGGKKRKVRVRLYGKGGLLSRLQALWRRAGRYGNPSGLRQNL